MRIIWSGLDVIISLLQPGNSIWWSSHSLWFRCWNISRDLLFFTQYTGSSIIYVVFSDLCVSSHEMPSLWWLVIWRASRSLFTPPCRPPPPTPSHPPTRPSRPQTRPGEPASGEMSSLQPPPSSTCPRWRAGPGLPAFCQRRPPIMTLIPSLGGLGWRGQPLSSFTPRV